MMFRLVLSNETVFFAIGARSNHKKAMARRIGRKTEFVSFFSCVGAVMDGLEKKEDGRNVYGVSISKQHVIT